MKSGAYKEIRLKELKKWQTFLIERFDPLSHFIMISLFVLAHFLLILLSQDTPFTYDSLTKLLFVTVGTILFFMKLRFYDEIKDYETDLDKNPTRPLPRGLVSHYDLKKAIESAILFEMVFFSINGWAGTLAIIIAIAYSLCMYKEFFIPTLIRPHLTTYATSHTVVTFFLSLAIFASLTNAFLWELPQDYFIFSLMSWLLFNIFELGRKTYQPQEEREGVPTYSNVWGRPGAILLVLAQAFLATWLSLKLSVITDDLYYQIVIAINGLLALSGLIYLISKKTVTGAIYRGFSSVYILLIYLALILIFIKPLMGFN